MKLPSSAPAAASEQAIGGTITFADASADDNAMFIFQVPQDATPGSTFFYFAPLYNLPSGTPTEGHWGVDCIAIANADADAAPSTGSAEVALDTPSADKWDLSTAVQLPMAVSASGDEVMACNLWHDVDDPFGGTVHVAGVKVTYTATSLR
jgi:hypothetical protein